MPNSSVYIPPTLPYPTLPRRALLASVHITGFFLVLHVTFDFL